MRKTSQFANDQRYQLRLSQNVDFNFLKLIVEAVNTAGNVSFKKYSFEKRKRYK